MTLLLSWQPRQAVPMTHSLLSHRCILVHRFYPCATCSLCNCSHACPYFNISSADTIPSLSFPFCLYLPFHCTGCMPYFITTSLLLSLLAFVTSSFYHIISRCLMVLLSIHTLGLLLSTSYYTAPHSWASESSFLLSATNQANCLSSSTSTLPDSLYACIFLILLSDKLIHFINNYNLYNSYTNTKTYNAPTGLVNEQ